MQLEYNPSFLIEYTCLPFFREPLLYFSIYQLTAKKQNYVLNLEKRFGVSDGFLECASSFRGLYKQVREILDLSPNTIFTIKELDFSKKDKSRKEQIRQLVIKHNFCRTLEKRI